MNTHPRHDPRRVLHDRELLLLLEEHGSLSRSHAAALSSMSESTLRRVSNELLQAGLLSLRYGAETPDQGKTDLLCFSRFGVLTLLEITPTRLHFRMEDTRGECLHAQSRLRNPFLPTEEDIRLLQGKLSPLMKAPWGASDLPILPPVLLLSPDADQELVKTAVARVFPPTAVLTTEQASAIALTNHPFPRDRRDLLLLHDGEEPYATLLYRQPHDPPLSPSPYTPCLTEKLRQCIAKAPPGTSARAEGLAAFLQGLCDYISPSCVVLEGELVSPLQGTLQSSVEKALPRQTPLLSLTYSRSHPSLAHRGALLHARRILWSRRLEELKPRS